MSLSGTKLGGQTIHLQWCRSPSNKQQSRGQIVTVLILDQIVVALRLGQIVAALRLGQIVAALRFEERESLRRICHKGARQLGTSPHATGQGPRLPQRPVRSLMACEGHHMEVRLL
ncbi:hypothetical protein H5410_061271 [Solanum commersonii]|uniref:Uncharacterized protein n=1 Tax=Solanum commersonii TaxID=4109 RepID=A0A9J5W7M7_SOLCO|nr:hypothetical protein H5410_061271 [Solanum commersonii]